MSWENNFDWYIPHSRQCSTNEETWKTKLLLGLVDRFALKFFNRFPGCFGRKPRKTARCFAEHFCSFTRRSFRPENVTANEASKALQTTLDKRTPLLLFVRQHKRLKTLKKYYTRLRLILTTVNWGLPFWIALVVRVPVTGLYSTEFAATNRWSGANIWMCCGWFGSTIYVRPLFWSWVMRFTVGWLTVVVCVAGTVPGAAKFIWGEETAVASIFKAKKWN